MTYTIPENVKTELTYGFLKDFRDLLFRKFSGLSLSDFADVISMLEGTCGYIDVLKFVSEKHNASNVMSYYESLDAYPSDAFCCAITNLMIENKLILNYSRILFEQELGIKSDDIVFCNECFGLFTKDQTILVEQYDELNSVNICLGCNDKQLLEKSS